MGRHCQYREEDGFVTYDAYTGDVRAYHLRYRRPT